jgi:hypothetical protein
LSEGTAANPNREVVSPSLAHLVHMCSIPNVKLRPAPRMGVWRSGKRKSMMVLKLALSFQVD